MSISRAPRLIDLRWGESGPRLTLVGKGVCFDTGGLNLKPGGSFHLGDAGTAPQGFDWDKWLGPTRMVPYSQFWHRRWYWWWLPSAR